jgi:xanthine dehydrogenase accessory factor
MNLNERIIAIKSGGEMASAVAWRLHHARMRRIVILETAHPLAVRRTVSFCEAVHDGTSMVEDVRGVRIDSPGEIEAVWAAGDIPVLVDPSWDSLKAIRPDVVVDAIIAKRNLGTRMDEAPLVIGMGPGFAAGRDAHIAATTWGASSPKARPHPTRASPEPSAGSPRSASCAPPYRAS